MASSFWGGFASTLLGERQQAEADDREQKKLMFLKSLETSTRVEQRDGRWVEVTIDGLGKEKGTRPLSENEVKTQIARQQREQAESSKATSDATLSEFNAKHAPEKFNADLASTQADIAYKKGATANDTARVGLEAQRVGLEKAQQAASLDAYNKTKTKDFSYSDVMEAASSDSDITDMLRLNGASAHNYFMQQAQAAAARLKGRATVAQAVAMIKTNMLNKFGDSTYQVKHPPKGLDTSGTSLTP